MKTEVMDNIAVHRWHWWTRTNYPHRAVALLIVLSCIFLSQNNEAYGEVYSSASDMKNIFKMEVDLANSLSEYARKTQLKLNRINKYIQV